LIWNTLHGTGKREPAGWFEDYRRKFLPSGKNGRASDAFYPSIRTGRDLPLSTDDTDLNCDTRFRSGLGERFFGVPTNVIGSDNKKLLFPED
jgi:hypothetical protein